MSLIWTPLALLFVMAGAGVAVLVWRSRHPEAFNAPGAALVTGWAAIAGGVLLSGAVLSIRGQSSPWFDPSMALAVLGSGGLGMGAFLYLRSQNNVLPAETRKWMRCLGVTVGLSGIVAFVGGLAWFLLAAPNQSRPIGEGADRPDGNRTGRRGQSNKRFIGVTLAPVGFLTPVR